MTNFDKELQGRIRAALVRWHKAQERADAAERIGDTETAREWGEIARRRRETVINLMRQQEIPTTIGVTYANR